LPNSSEDEEQDGEERMVTGILQADDQDSVEERNSREEEQHSRREEENFTQGVNQDNNDQDTDTHETEEEQPPNMASDSSSRIPESTLSSPASPNSGNLPPTYDDLDIPIALRKSSRTTELPSKFKDFDISGYVSYSKIGSGYKSFIAAMESAIPIPKGWQEAKLYPEWREAMIEEMEALEKNGTWELSALPDNKKVVGCKWVFTIKHTPNGKVQRYKARLVAKGYSQTYGVDYDETFAPVAKMNTIRTLISLATNLKWELFQLDVKNAFLHGDLKEEVYMEIPPGFHTHETNGKVCKLRKSLYGLKQSPRAWFGRFRMEICSWGYLQSNADHTLFYKHVKGKIAILVVYVDDIVITGNAEEEIHQLKKNLAKSFEVKDLGHLHYFLGIEVAYGVEGTFLSQRKYVLDLLAETRMLDCKPASTPIEQNHRIKADDGESIDKYKYQRLVGRLIYLSHTRPDIAYAVSVVSRYMHNPCTSHMKAVRRILRYLKGCPGKGILFSRCGNLDVEGYSDADWGGNIDDRKSTSGYCVFVGRNLVSWRSKKQSVVARSTAEAEFRAMASGLCELMWIKILLCELRLFNGAPLRLYCDNQATINIVHNPVHHDRTKHIEIDRHFIKDNLDKRRLHVLYVRSGDQLADVLTKGINVVSFQNVCNKMRLVDIFASS
jgi:hypothetical protein